MFIYTYAGAENDEDIARVIEIMGSISSDFLLRIHSEEWLMKKYGNDYRNVCISREALAEYINSRMTPPAINIGLTFAPFSFPEDVEEADSVHELLSEIDYMEEREEIFFETSKTAAKAWYEHRLDVTLAARFLPLIKSDCGELMIHAPHLYAFLHHVEKLPELAVFLSVPSGANRDLLCAAYDATSSKDSLF